MMGSFVHKGNAHCGNNPSRNKARKPITRRMRCAPVSRDSHGVPSGAVTITKITWMALKNKPRLPISTKKATGKEMEARPSQIAKRGGNPASKGIPVNAMLASTSPEVAKGRIRPKPLKSFKFDVGECTFRISKASAQTTRLR